MYTFEQLLIPVWDTKIVYEEFLTMVREQGIANAPLLFKPKNIISVTSADRAVAYEEGIDWEIQDNMFCLTPTSRIFAFEEDEVIFDEKKEGSSFATIDGKYSLFHEGHYFHDRQISVTYEKNDEYSGYKVDFCGGKLPKTMRKLESGEALRITLFGDSISYGANSSSITNVAPFLPNWAELLVGNLKKHYHDKIELLNPSVSGMTARWGAENAARVANQNPADLFIIAFGMNDRNLPEQFGENIQKIKDAFEQQCPNAEFILCATTLPNKRLKNFYCYQDAYADALYAMSEEGTVVADFGGMQKFILQTKRFIDTSGNNVNHPNDFMARCHAQLMSDMLIKR